MNTLEAQTAYIGSTEIQQVRLGDQLVLAPNGDILWYKANEIPSLDLRFAESKSLVDATTGTNLIDHTRAASISTYVGSDGLIKTAAANLLTYSEEFDDASWVNSGSPASTVTANNIAAPNGTITADRINATVNIAGVYKSVPVAANVPVTLSGYIKAGNNINKVLFRDDTDAGRHIAVRLSDGAIVATEGSVTSSSSTPLGDGWYRIVMTYTPTSNIARWWFRNDTNNSGDFYLWGAQVEQSSTVGEYVKTTSTINSAPRFDHDPTTGESLGLLVEEQRTNLLTYSEEFDQATTDWLQDDSTIDSDAIEAPDGNNTADKLIATGGAADHNVRKDFSATAGTTYTFSCFLKAAERSAFELQFRVSSIWPSNENQIIGFTLTGNGSYSVRSGSPTGDIIALDNGWYRCHITATAAVTGTAQVRVQDVYDADDEGIYIWGAQLEAGPFPTSYIPTTDSTVTRAADVASISGSNYTSWANNSAGTIFTDSKAINSTSQTQALYLFNGTSYFVSLRQPQGAGNKFRANIGNVFTPSPGTGDTLSSGVSKAAVAYTTTTGRLQVGAASDEVTTAGALDATELFIGSLGLGTHFNGTVKRFVFWPARLPNETLQGITQ